MTTQNYDIIVVGAGHAGCEAACAAANMGAKVLLITFDMEKMAQMSCNPAIGGIAKGQIIREIDALGGQSAIITDKTTIQFRMLNRSKGPAMWSPRAQCDRMKFSKEWRMLIENTNNLDIFQDEVVSIIVENYKVKGIVTRIGVIYYSRSVILTNGTFLNGLIHIGRVKIEGGRVAESASKGLSEQLQSLGFKAGRMKTGTPARIDGNSIDFSKLQKQDGDSDLRKFSFLPDIKTNLLQRPCYITYTNPVVHRILERGFADSPMYNGTIQSIGPRYCPSIEDKIVTFADKNAHHIFLEPEGSDTNEYYINGFSSSLPWNIQWEAIRHMMGLENVRLFRPGYAIEYDYFYPTQIYHTLETKIISNLYFAGQINGTTGYEEAAAQGLIAGINAVLKLKEQSEFVLRRDQAYIGVLIDDLVTKGVDEPYRMFTSRAEYRILLRQDNADLRLTNLSNQLGLVSSLRYDLYKEKVECIKVIIGFVQNYSVTPNTINEYLQSNDSSPIKQKLKLEELVLRPQVSLKSLISFIPELRSLINNIPRVTNELLETTENEIKYKGYIERERSNAQKIHKLEHISIPSGFNFKNVSSLSMESRIKLSKIQPKTIAQASRIPGITPSDISILLVRLGR